MLPKAIARPIEQLREPITSAVIFYSIPQKSKPERFETCLILGNAFSLLPQPPSANSFLLTAASLQHLLHTLTGFDPSTSHLSLGYRQGLWALGYGRRLMVRRF